MTTTVPAVKAALVTILTAALPTVQVIYGAPGGEAILGPSVLTVGETVEGRVDPDALNLDTAGERYRVFCRLSCTVDLPGDDGAQAAAELAWGFLAVAERAVRESYAQDLTGALATAGALGANSTGEFTSTDVAVPSGRNTTIEFGYDVIAQRT